MNAKELFSQLSLMCEDYSSYVKGYSDEEGVKCFNSYVRPEDIDESSRFVGSDLMNAFLKKHKKSTTFASIYRQAYYWNKYKVFYRFNEDLENEIKRSDIDKTMVVPAILLNQCPFSSFFIQTRGGIIDWGLENKLSKGNAGIKGDGLGFFCTISNGMEYSRDKNRLVKTGNKILDISACAEQKDGKNISVISVSMTIPSNNSLSTIEESIVYGADYDKAYSKEEAEYCRQYDMNVLLTALQYVLHLCSENSNITPVKVQKAKSWASKKEKLLSKAKIYDVSVRYFPNRNTIRYIRGSSKTSTGITKSPHVRRAHWAYRWVGRKEERHLELRWVREAYIHKELGSSGTIVNVVNSKEKEG